MTDVNRPFWLGSLVGEVKRKGGGGATKDPIVPVTSELRQRLAQEVSVLADRAAAIGATEQRPLPVLLRLRPQALAKSNRPDELLTQLSLMPVAAERPGELILPGTPSRLRSLARRIESIHSKKGIYEVSTLRDLTLWSALAASRRSSDGLLEVGNDYFDALTVELFPWAAPFVGEIAQLVASEVPSSEMVIRPPTRGAVELASHSARPTVYLRNVPRAALASLLASSFVRRASVTPVYAVSRQQSGTVGATGSIGAPPPGGSPVVGVLDAGVSRSALGPAVVSAESYDPPARRSEVHGTFVAGLVVWPRLANSDPAYPEDTAFVVDAQVIDATAGTAEDVLIERIDEVVRLYPDVRVWNCSFGQGDAGTSVYGTFAQQLDALAEELDVLFVIAAGNYDAADRTWPPSGPLADGIGSPAEAVRGVTVGARTLLDGRTPHSAAASYSRRGPSFSLDAKPELVHWAGDLDHDGSVDSTGVISIATDGTLRRDVGTSFAAPLVATTAANLWQLLGTAGAPSVASELVRAMLVHSARLNELDNVAGSEVPKHYRSYQGWGTPPSASDALVDQEWSFTTIHEVQIDPGMVWFKRPFPVPESLIEDGKFRGEVLVTAAFRPPVNANFGSEAVRRNIEVAFGKIDATGSFHGITSGGGGKSLWESDRLSDGKYSPLRTVYAVAPEGQAGVEWALRLSLEERLKDEYPLDQLVHVIVTLRSVDKQGAVYVEGAAAIERLRYPAVRLDADITTRLRTGAGPHL